MSREKRIEQEIGWFKVAFTLAVITDVSLIAWLAQNFATARPVLVVLGSLVAVGLAAFIIWINQSVYRRLAELEHL